MCPFMLENLVNRPEVRQFLSEFGEEATCQKIQESFNQSDMFVKEMFPEEEEESVSSEESEPSCTESESESEDEGIECPLKVHSINVTGQRIKPAQKTPQQGFGKQTTQGGFGGQTPQFKYGGGH